MINISENDFRGVDLNLLVTFFVLMRERSVSRAAFKMHVGQPALSGSLARLRDVFEDELFIRTSAGMVPTVRALELAQALEPAIHTVHAAIQPTRFVPKTSERIFLIGMPDWVEMWLMPELQNHLRIAAPRVRIAVKSTDRTRAERMLENNEMQLGVSVLTKTQSWQRSSELLSMNYRCVFDPALLPIGRTLPVSEYLAHPHLFISYQGDFEGLVDRKLAESGESRAVIFSTPHFGTLPFLLKKVPAFATVPEYFAMQCNRIFGLRAMKVPIDLPDFLLSLTWHAQHDADAGLCWLRQTIQNIVKRPGISPGLASESKKNKLR